MKHVVVTEPIHPDGLALLEARDDISLTALQGDPADIAAAIVDAHGVLVRTVELREGVLAKASRLQVVSRHGVGCDNVAVDYMSRRGLPVAIAADANAVSVAEHVMMMLLALTKRTFLYDEHTRNGGFHERGKHKTFELNGRHILIVGFGRIGKKLAPLCKAFGMRVTVADIALDAEYARQLGCETVEDFRPVLPVADFVSMHVPLNASTRHLIAAAELAAMPNHAMLINCARGGVVDEQALAAAIHSGGIAATGSDVFTVEPPGSDNPLLSMQNSVLSPHNAATTTEGSRRMATGAAQNILDYFDGKLDARFIFNAADLAK